MKVPNDFEKMFTVPTWRMIDEMQQEIDELHAENALKLTQILDLEQLIWGMRQRIVDGFPCWCHSPYHPELEHSGYCMRARQATEMFWKKPDEQK